MARLTLLLFPSSQSNSRTPGFCLRPGRRGLEKSRDRAPSAARIAGCRSLAMVLQENEPLAGLSQTSRCPFLAPAGQDRRRGPFPAQGPEVARAQPVGNADCLSAGPGGAKSDSTEEDEASSTESAQNGDESPQAGAEGSRRRGDQDEALARVAELENHIKELQHQQKEMNIEMKLEGALLEGELAAEWREVQREEQLVLHLQRRFAEMVRRCHAEREKEKARLGKERRKVEELQRQHAESQTHLETQPESMRERMQSQLQQTSEMLEGALKSYEDLEFQQLERESRLEEEKEEACQALVRQIAQVQKSLEERKRKVCRLEAQVRFGQEHMAGESRKLAQEKGEAIQSLNLERRRLEELGKACESQSGDDSPVSNQELTKLMFTQKTDRKVVVLGCDQRDPACVFSVRSSVQSSFGLQRSASLPRRRGNRPAPRPTPRPLSFNDNGGLDSDILALQLSAGGDRRCVPLTHLNAPLYPLGGPYSVGSCVTKLAEMERMVREAMAERERLLQAREAKRVAQGETQHTEPPPPAQDRSPGPAREPPAPAPLDLRAHLEASGHSLETCPEVRVTGRACRGFLVKMGGRIKTWKKRWFCFDRQRRLLAYYVDKEEAKLKGVIYFQAIEEVYYDHLRSAFKSPNPKLTFCVKTYDRLFCLVAPSAEAMRIWMDAIVTAAEENTRY
ncbi:pleckstrin homology-like domain family B member 3 isoform X3 [Chelonia mydas]|uniref:pleckstrin homology-like domain family B member 3 isoform X3 n=1 Tax=Chelonia mydas TaxID=8469 RepID=UPI001CA9416C|nr:pleckstrin homology-like domain family B member 3 isoform X3 [Chelonia mydas]